MQQMNIEKLSFKPLLCVDTSTLLMLNHSLLHTEAVFPIALRNAEK